VRRHRQIVTPKCGAPVGVAACRIKTARTLRATGIAIVAAGLLTGCQIASEGAGPTADGTGTKVAEARFAPIGGSSITGAAIIHPYAGGVQVRVNFNGAAPGRYRVMIHANGNCTSPNGFSAGPPWAPPGVKLAEEGYPMLKNDDSASVVSWLPGYKMDGPDGVMGRSVVVHAGGRGPLDAQPGVANDRIGCGVITIPARPPILDFL
jgi:superoxide dismutase, Cu-Zn family